MSSHMTGDSTDEGTKADRNIGDGQVRFSIPIEIPHRHRSRHTITKKACHHRIRGLASRRERPIAVAQKNRDGVVAGVGDGEVRISIQIEIRDGDGRRVYPNADRRIRRLLERNALSGGCREREKRRHEQRKENDRDVRHLDVKGFHVGFPLACHACLDCAQARPGKAAAEIICTTAQKEHHSSLCIETSSRPSNEFRAFDSNCRERCRRTGLATYLLLS